jgi:hypothetical protein
MKNCKEYPMSYFVLLMVLSWDAFLLAGTCYLIVNYGWSKLFLLAAFIICILSISSMCKKCRRNFCRYCGEIKINEDLKCQS